MPTTPSGSGGPALAAFFSSGAASVAVDVVEGGVGAAGAGAGAVTVTVLVAVSLARPRRIPPLPGPSMSSA
ncbi:MAG: hypothetical protein M3417_05090 [Actinomycetota bacterium]|nr:hypothetical protein [Actinomycetota bacterium]